MAVAETEQVIIGTAGHIDHGKTALVKALTGIDADALPEEKRRGMTIELGFVFMDTPGLDKQIVFIDVPGHEKLVKTMVAGASNIDTALLVIAADEGISAQTIEHFEILELLGIKRGIIALTKTDLVDNERVHAVTDKVRDLVSGSFLADAPILPVSSVTGAGVDEIKSGLIELSGKAEKHPDRGIFRMPVDRVFTMRGFGTVIAGTILSGEVSIGDTIEIFPDSITAKVRGIQIHNQNTEKSYIRRRTAINLQDIEKDKLRRGQCAGAPGSLFSTNRLDARLYLLRSYSKELKNRARVRLHIGTDEIISRLVLLDRDSLIPGQTAVVQFVLEAPTVALPKDRFVIRTFSPLMTVGGGVILDSKPTRHKRFDTQAVEDLKKLGGELSDVVEHMFKKTHFVSRSPTEVALSIGEREKEVREVTTRLHEEGKLVKVAAKYLHSECYDDLCGKLVATIRDYFGKYPYRLSMPLADVQSQFLRLADRQTFETIIEDLCKKKITYKKGVKIGLVGHKLQLKPNEQEFADRIVRIFREAGFATPLEEDIRKDVGIVPETFKNIMDSLVEQEHLVRLSEKVTYHRECVQEVREIVEEHIRENQGITVGELRDRLGVSRKYALAILEYFDKIRLTERDGDKHVIIRSGKV